MPRVDSEGFEQPKKTAALPAVRDAVPTESHNRYGALASLPDEEVDQPQSELSTRGSALRKEKTNYAKPKKTEPNVTKAQSEPLSPETEVEQAQQVFDRPHQASYFIPGKAEGRAVQVLLDTGCTTNLIGKHVFDRLPERVRSQKKE